MKKDSSNPYDPELTLEEEKIVSKLSKDDLIRVDLELMKHASKFQRKVAMIVGIAMRRLEEEYPNIPSKFYALRVEALVEDEYLEAFGNLKRMRYSEVRLTGKSYDFTISKEAKKAIENSVKRESYFIFKSEDFSKIKKYSSAIDILEQGLSNYPNSEKLYKSIGNVFYTIGEYSEAFKNLDKAIELSQNNISLYFTKAYWEFDIKLYIDSIENFTKIIDANNQFFIGTAYNYRAMAFIYTGRYEDALRDYNMIPEDHDIGLYKGRKFDNYLSKQEILDRIKSSK